MESAVTMIFVIWGSSGSFRGGVGFKPGPGGRNRQDEISGTRAEIGRSSSLLLPEGFPRDVYNPFFPAEFYKLGCPACSAARTAFLQVYPGNIYIFMMVCPRKVI